MDARQRYARAMEWTYIGCIVLSGTALVVITLIIPLGVFMRYAMDRPLSWPEPAAVVMMVMFSFLGGAAVYRANVHIAVEALLNAVRPALRRVMLWGADLCVGLDRRLHARLRHAPVPGHVVPDDGRVSRPQAGHRLSADPDRRPVDTCCSSSSGDGSAPPPPTSIMYSDQPTDLE